jgi:hypothetical protein
MTVAEAAPFGIRLDVRIALAPPDEPAVSSRRPPLFLLHSSLLI